MFNQKDAVIKTDNKIINYKGIFKKELSFFQGVALVICATIGAGILSVPFAISHVGIKIGIFYILILGLLMMGLNLLLGYVTTKTNKNLQIVGLAKEYLGKKSEIFMTFIVYLMFFGTLVVYIIGIGNILSNLFSGSSFVWSLLFFFIASIFIINGLRSIKTVEFLISIALFIVVLLISYFSLPHIEYSNLIHVNWSDFLLPYGVILFSLHGTSSIPEVHALLKNRDSDFKKVIITSGLIILFIYIIFSIVILGVSGLETTEIATIGMENKVGRIMYFFINIFAVLAMSSSFLMAGLSLKDSLMWDYKIKNFLANTITLLVPLTIFILGLRQFISAINIVGGVFISLEMFMILLIYWKAANDGKINKSKYQLHHTLFLVMALILVLIIGTIYSLLNLF